MAERSVMRREGRIAGALCLVAALSGCQPSQPPAVPVSGVVYLRRAAGLEIVETQADTVTFIPIQGAKVTFIGDGGSEASGVTDGLGRFRLKTYLPADETLDGVAPGQYRVTVKKLKLVSDASVQAGSRATWHEPPLPAIYADPTTTTLRAQVAAMRPEQTRREPEATFRFELLAQGPEAK